MSTAAERAVWFEGYVRTYLERDLQTLSSSVGPPRGQGQPKGVYGAQVRQTLTLAFCGGVGRR